MCVCTLSRFSHVLLFMTLWTVAHQAPLSMEFPRQEYWRGIAIPLSRGSSQPRDQTHISCVSYTAGVFFTAEPPGGGGWVGWEGLDLLPQNLVIQLPGIYLRKLKTYVHVETYTHVIAALFIIAEKQKQLKCPSADAWINKTKNFILKLNLCFKKPTFTKQTVLCDTAYFINNLMQSNDILQKICGSSSTALLF